MRGAFSYSSFFHSSLSFPKHIIFELYSQPALFAEREATLPGDIESRYFVEAAAKALEVLESFDSPEEELSIMEVARRVGMTYSSTFRRARHA